MKNPESEAAEDAEERSRLQDQEIQRQYIAAVPELAELPTRDLKFQRDDIERRLGELEAQLIDATPEERIELEGRRTLATQRLTAIKHLLATRPPEDTSNT